MNGDKPLGIAVSVIDAELYAAFMNEKDKFAVMYDAGVFSMPFGKAIISFHEQHIQNIVLEKSVYQFKKPINI